MLNFNFIFALFRWVVGLPKVISVNLILYYFFFFLCVKKKGLSTVFKAIILRKFGFELFNCYSSSYAINLNLIAKVMEVRKSLTDQEKGKEKQKWNWKEKLWKNSFESPTGKNLFAKACKIFKVLWQKSTQMV